MRSKGHVISVILMLLAVSGCGSNAVSTIPVHLYVVCDSTSEARIEAQRAFDEWASQAMYQPGSTFDMWIAGLDRYSYRRHFVACIPTSWGSNVMEAKATFLRTARERIPILHPLVPQESVLPEGSGFPGPAAPGIPKLVVFVGTTMVPPEVWQPVADSAAAEKLHTAVLWDRSSSTVGSNATENLTKAFNLWLADGFAVVGSTFRVYLAGNSYDTARQVYSVTVPGVPPAQKVASLLGARNELSRLVVSEGTNNSAIAEVLGVAVNELREHNGQYELVIFSDLRQYTPGTWNFEESIPRADRFISWLKRENLLMDLKDIPITVVGLHHFRSPQAGLYDASLAVQLRNTWEEVFRAMGATQVRLFTALNEDAFTP